jgi:hypothetical protein
MEIVAAEEVVTYKPDPVVSVAGRFEQFKRDSKKECVKKHRANLCRAKDRWHKQGWKLGCKIRQAKTKGRDGECLWHQLAIVTKVESYWTYRIPFKDITRQFRV